MVATWIEAAAKGRHGGAVRAGMWSVVVIGTHPVESDQEVWLELSAEDVALGPLPAFWLENKGVNSFWHVPIPPQSVGARLRYRSGARQDGAEAVYSPYQDVVVRPNLPDRTDVAGSPSEALVGNRMMTARVDGRGTTYDVYFPTVGLHSDVRPGEGDLPQSRSHFRGITAGLAVGRRLDWFAERLPWDVFQRYQGATNLLVTELKWRHGPIRVLATDFVAAGPDLPRTKGGSESPGQYIKRFRIANDGPESRSALFGVYVQAEVNGGIGEPGLTWHDGDATLLATNRGHGHSNRKLARDSTVEFALALDGRGAVQCEPTGRNEALLFRSLELPPGESVEVDFLISGAFTGWRGDQGTFEHWLRPALAWFRGSDLDEIEHEAAASWDRYVEPLPTLVFPRPVYAVSLRRSALGAALHADAKWGAITAGFDRGLNAYCWPRDALWAGGAIDRAGHPRIGRGVFEWLSRVRVHSRPFSYWFQKYTIDGWPEWETPAVDQTAMIPWGLERHYRRTGDGEFLASSWPMIEQAAAVCDGNSGHPGLRRLDDLDLITSASIWDNRYAAFLYSNASAVAGLRASARLAQILDRPEEASRWREQADRTWEEGVLRHLVDAGSGRFLEARRLSTRRGLWAMDPENCVERSSAVDISLLGPAVPFGLIPASDPKMRRSAEAILKHNAAGGDPNALTCWSPDPARPNARDAPSDALQHDASSLATLWMARYLLQLGRETGEGRHWNRALAMLDDILGRLGPLGLALKGPIGRDGTGEAGLRPSPSVWALHATLIETMLDLAGLDYDAAANRLILAPALPPAWPQIGASGPYACGTVSYRLERPVGGVTHRLILEADLRRPTRLQVDIACPGLPDLGPWNARPGAPPPSFDHASRRLAWGVELPAGESRHEWTWG